MKTILSKIRIWLWPMAAVCAAGCQTNPQPEASSTNRALNYEQRTYLLVDSMVETHCKLLKEMAAAHKAGAIWEMSNAMKKLSEDFAYAITRIGLQADSADRLERSLEKGCPQ